MPWQRGIVLHDLSLFRHLPPKWTIAFLPKWISCKALFSFWLRAHYHYGVHAGQPASTFCAGIWGWLKNNGILKKRTVDVKQYDTNADAWNCKGKYSTEHMQKVARIYFILGHQKKSHIQMSLTSAEALIQFRVLFCVFCRIRTQGKWGGVPWACG